MLEGLCTTEASRISYHHSLWFLIILTVRCVPKPSIKIIKVTRPPRVTTGKWGSFAALCRPRALNLKFISFQVYNTEASQPFSASNLTECNAHPCCEPRGFGNGSKVPCSSALRRADASSRLGLLLNYHNLLGFRFLLSLLTWNV